MTTVDDGSEIFVAEISAANWASFCQDIPHCLMEAEGEDPQLEAYLSRTMKTRKNHSYRPSCEGSSRRYSFGDDCSESVELTKEIAGLKEEVLPQPLCRVT